MLSQRRPARPGSTRRVTPRTAARTGPAGLAVLSTVTLGTGLASAVPASADTFTNSIGPCTAVSSADPHRPGPVLRWGPLKLQLLGVLKWQARQRAQLDTVELGHGV